MPSVNHRRMSSSRRTGLVSLKKSMHYQVLRIFFVHQRLRASSRAYHPMVLSSSSTSMRTSVMLLHSSQALIPHFISHFQTSACNKQFNYMTACAPTSNGRAYVCEKLIVS